MKVLISCYACSPYKGSEPGMGWNFVKSLSKFHELHIITESKFQSDLEKYFLEHPEEQKFYNFYFIKKERHKKLRKIYPPSYYWFYNKWQKKALILARELDKIHNFDLIHQLNMVGYREPGYLYKLNKPLVWGPTGGMCISPWCLLPSTGLYGMLYYGARNIINIWQMNLKTRIKTFANKANAIIAATQDNHDKILKLWNKEAIIIPEVGLMNNTSNIVLKKRNSKVLKLAWSGQHTPGKALNLLLDSLHIINDNTNIELHVLGKGKCTSKWQKLAKKLSLYNIKWYGWLERDKAVQVMSNCDVFCITSLADLTSTVLLEALSYGLPVIVLNHVGFTNVVNDSCGIKINIRTKKQVVEDFAKAIISLRDNEDMRFSLSNGALSRAKEYTWDKKVETINNIYNQIVNE